MLGGCSLVSLSFSLLGLLFPLTMVSSAQQVSIPAVKPHERTLFAESFAAEKVWVWQKRLNLQDWNITVAIARATELKPKTLGNIHWDSDKKTATIHVLDPADYTLPFEAMLKDMEFTVVHELIHLELLRCWPRYSVPTRTGAMRSMPSTTWPRRCLISTAPNRRHLPNPMLKCME